MKNVIEHLKTTSDKHPERIALIQDSQKITFGGLYQEVLQTVHLYEQKGIGIGDQILVFVPMSIHLYRHVLALLYIGAVPVFIDEWVSFSRLKECMNCLECKAIIAPRKLLLISFFIKKLKDVSVKIFPSAQSTKCSNAPLFIANPSSPALITFTTGTTGTPKAAIRTHGNLIAQFSALSKLLDPSIERSISTLPIVVLINIGLGRTSILPPADFKMSKPRTVVKLIAQMAQNKVASIIASPSVFKNIVGYSTQKSENVKELITGGGSVFPDLALEISEHFPAAKAQVVFGGTEADPISHIAMEILSHLSPEFILNSGLPIGKIAVETDLCIIPFSEEIITLRAEDKLYKMQLTDFSIGETIAAGPHVVAEYLNNKTAIARNKIKVADTVWHRSGDLAYRNNTNELFYFGRGNHSFEVNGNTFYPMLLEYFIQQKAGLSSFALSCKDGIVFAFVCKNERTKRLLIQSLLNQQKLTDVQFCFVKYIPKDKRHQTKIDYEALLKKAMSISTKKPETKH